MNADIDNSTRFPIAFLLASYRGGTRYLKDRMLIDAYIGAMGLVAGAFFVLWHGAIVVASAQAARCTKWRFSRRVLLVATTIIAIAIGAMTIGIRDMPPAYQQYNTMKSDGSLKLR